jgi:pilus assembly protein CpaB
MKPKTMILMAVAVVCGLGASFMTQQYLKGATKKDDGPGEPTVAVLVAKARIASGKQVQEPEKAFEVKQYPVSIAPKNPIGDYNEIRDQRLKVDLEEGTALTAEHKLSKEQNSLADQLVPGQRAMAIKVGTVDIAGGFVLPGTRVDVACTMRGAEASSALILQHMLVLAVDTTDTRVAETKVIIGQTVTLAVSPEEALRLTLASSLGELRLLLKSAGDTTTITVGTVKASDLSTPIGRQPKSTEEDTQVKAKAPEPAPIIPDEVKDIKDPEPKQEVVKGPEKQAKTDVDDVTEPRKKVQKQHKIIVYDGSKREELVVLKKKTEDDDEDDDVPPAREERKEPKAKARDEEKKDEKKDEKKAAAPAGATRTPSTKTRNR